MLQLLRDLYCYLFGHSFHLSRYINKDVQKIHCCRCDRQFVIHHKFKMVIEWDSEFESLYSIDGPLNNGWKL